MEKLEKDLNNEENLLYQGKNLSKEDFTGWVLVTFDTEQCKLHTK